MRESRAASSLGLSSSLALLRLSRLGIGSIDSAEAAIAIGEIDDGFDKILATELRPEFLGDPKFAVADLPQEKIAQPQFAASPDH